MTFPNIDRLGYLGVIGLGLLLFCLSFYFGSIEPAQLELARMEKEISALASKSSAGAQAQGGGTGKPAPFPPVSMASESVKTLNDLAVQHGISIERASFVLSDQGGRPRLEVILPLKAGYPSLRAFLHDLLTIPPPPVVDELVFQRQQSSEAMVEANVHLSFYFSGAP